MRFILNTIFYEDLPGQTKTAKTRELVELLGRNNRLHDLEAAMRRFLEAQLFASHPEESTTFIAPGLPFTDDWLLITEYWLLIPDNAPPGQGEAAPEGEGVKLWVAVAAVEGEHGSVCDEDEGVVGIGGALGGNGHFHPPQCLCRRLIAKDKLVRVGEEVGNGRFKFLSVGKKRHTAPVMFLQAGCSVPG